MMTNLNTRITDTAGPRARARGSRFPARWWLALSAPLTACTANTAPMGAHDGGFGSNAGGSEGASSGATSGGEASTTTSGTSSGVGGSGSIGDDGGAPVVGDGGSESAGRFFLQNGEGSDGSVLIDAQGGIHLVYVPGPVRYAYCASQCDQASSWAAADVTGSLGSSAGIEAVLALDPQGRPRIMTVTLDGTYAYSECNADCTSATSWTTVNLVSSDLLGLYDYHDRFFTMDGQGNAAFVYEDENGRLNYESCASNCTNAASWQATRISSSSDYVRGALAQDSQGRTRLAWIDDGPNSDYVLKYAECDSACASASNWQKATLNIVGFTAPQVDVSLALDTQGRPRIGLHTSGTPSTSGLMADSTFYLSCDGGCTATDAGAAWAVQLVGTEPSNSLAMVLDSQGNPHMAYYDSNAGGVRYKWCTAGCNSTSTAATWQESFFADTDMDRTYARVTAANCTTSFWTHPEDDRLSMALGVDGTAAISLDAEHVQGGCSDPGVQGDAWGVYLRVLPAP